MNLDDLKAEWRMEIQRAEPKTGLRFDGFKRQVAELRRGIRFGSFWLVFAFLGVSIIEVFVQFVSLDRVGWMSKLGAVTWVLFTIWLVVVLYRSLELTRSDDWTLQLCTRPCGMGAVRHIRRGFRVCLLVLSARNPKDP